MPDFVWVFRGVITQSRTPLHKLFVIMVVDFMGKDPRPPTIVYCHVQCVFCRAQPLFQSILCSVQVPRHLQIAY